MCEDCSIAAVRLWHGVTAGCQGCNAREMARSQVAMRRRKTGRKDSDYLSALYEFNLTDDEVKTAAKADMMGRA